MTQPSEGGASPTPATLSLPKLLLLLVMVGGATLGIIEVIVRSVRPPPGYFPFNQREDSLYVLNPVRGYELRPTAHHDYITPEVHVSLDVSPDGFRSPSPTPGQTASYRILSIGDSFTFGLAVEARDTWSAQLGTLLQARDATTISVLNAGVPGYGLQQIRSRLAELLPVTNPDLVILGFTVQTFDRLQDPVGLFGGMAIRSSVIPKIRITDRGLLYSPYDSPRLRAIDYWLNRHFQFGAHLFGRAHGLLEPRREPTGNAGPPNLASAADSMRPALDQLRAIHELVAARCVPFLVLLINAQREGGGFDVTPDHPAAMYNEIVLKECDREQITCIDLLPQLQEQERGPTTFRTLHDQHWTPAAHRLAAEALLRVISTKSNGHKQLNDRCAPAASPHPKG